MNTVQSMAHVDRLSVTVKTTIYGDLTAAVAVGQLFTVTLSDIPPRMIFPGLALISFCHQSFCTAPQTINYLRYSKNIPRIAESVGSFAAAFGASYQKSTQHKIYIGAF